LKSKQDEKPADFPRIPFDDALRKILSAPPAPNVKPKKEKSQNKKTGK
jgi:hypothetical protein